uniref:Uncharacterized protein n=1 Tax=Anguilla anguilla TaxID=7936 RepID=A0A0E9XQM4_ANGAN
MLDKVVEHVDPLLQGPLQVFGEGQVLGVFANFLHPASLGFLGGLLCPVFIIVISVHSFRGIYVIVIPSFSAAGTVLFIFLSVLLFLLLFDRSTIILWWIFKNEGAELVSRVKHASVPTGFTGVTDGLFLGIDMQVSFWIVTLRTQHKFSDETIQHVLQFVRLVRSIDNVAVILGIKLGLGTQLTAKKLGGIRWRPI